MLTINERFAKLIGRKEAAVEVVQEEIKEAVSEETTQEGPQAFGYGGDMGYGPSVYTNTPLVGFGIYNGEKTPGALGMPINLRSDPATIRYRAYEAYTTSDVINILIGRLETTVIGNGLQMQSEPYEKILKLEKVDIAKLPELKSNVEEYFAMYCNSNRADFAGMNNLHVNAAKTFKAGVLGGDCLIILRVDEKYNVTSQVIAGEHLFTPMIDQQLQQQITSRKTVIFGGIEIDEKGKQIAFYVRKRQVDALAEMGNLEYARIEAYNEKTGMQMAWMYYGKKDRIDSPRGISHLSPILEKNKKLDRFTEATVKSAEEHAKTVYTVVHGKTSTGENPFISGPRAQVGGVVAPDYYLEGQVAANKIAISTEGDVFNLPPDSELKTVSSNAEINYEPFWKAIFVQLSASIGMPPEVALQQYNSNYSASRAAINGWGYIVDVYRKGLAEKFYQPFYDLWLYCHILKNKVDAPGYLEAKQSGNTEIIEAYSAAKFTGVNMPHIDPLKEINAIRAALGEGYADVPLISFEQATALNGSGDWENNVKKLAEEKKMVDGLDVIPKPEPVVTNTATPAKKPVKNKPIKK